MENVMRKTALIPFVILALIFAACSSDDGVTPIPPTPKPDYDSVETTLTKNYMPITKGSGKGFDLKIEDGEPHQLRELDGVEVPDADDTFWSLAYVMLFTDQHVTDEQNPARTAFFDTTTVFDGLFSASFRPEEDLSPHLLNALVLSGNGICEKFGRNFDMVFSLGDFGDNGAQAELEWAMGILDGTSSGSIAPWTGSEVRDFGSQQAFDPYVRPGEPSSNAPFPVVGLDKSNGDQMPWYSAVGNHDVLNVGNFPVDNPKCNESQT